MHCLFRYCRCDKIGNKISVDLYLYLTYTIDHNGQCFYQRAASLSSSPNAESNFFKKQKILRSIETHLPHFQMWLPHSYSFIFIFEALYAILKTSSRRLTKSKKPTKQVILEQRKRITSQCYCLGNVCIRMMILLPR